nr:Hint domain-containing protein [uncultured Acetobacter sp.]
MTTTIISSGLTASGVSVLRGDTLIIASAGSALSTTVADSGQLQVQSGGTIASTTISGPADTEAEHQSVLVNSGGSALDTTVFHDQLIILNGAYASGVTLNDGGITVKGTAAVVSGMIINSQGNYAAYVDGGTIYNTVVNEGGATCEYADAGSQTGAGGQAYNTLINSTAYDEVISGTTYTETVLSGGQQFLVTNAATASGTILSGGQVEAYAGRTVQTVISAGGQEVLSGTAVASGSVIMQAGSQAVNTGATASGTVMSGGQQTVAGTDSAALVQSGGKDQIIAGGVARSDTVAAGGSMSIGSSGQADSTQVAANGFVDVLSGGVASGSVIARYATQTVENGGIASASVVSTGRQYVYGSAAGNSVTALGENRIMSGGVTRNDSISNHGHETVYAGGLAENTTYGSAGFGYIQGSSLNATVLSGGALFISTGGVASATTLMSNGTAYVTGSAAGTIVSNGGTETVLSGGVASNTHILSGGSETVSSGASAENEMISAGGRLTVSSGGDIENTTLMSGGAIDVDSLHYAGTTAAQIEGDTLVVTQGDETYSIALAGDYSDYHATFAADTDGSTVVTLDEGTEVCFLPGTMIRHADGETAVEDLRIGDEVLTFAHGVAQPRAVIWAGHRHTSVKTGLPDDEAGYPVRICKGAVADAVPHTDLLVTPEHCLFFEGRFIPARMLVNGISVFYDHSITEYSYFHIETEEHAVIMANGLLTESYLDTGNRRSFGQSGTLARLGGTVRSWAEDAAVPLAVDRATVEPIFRRLIARAEEHGTDRWEQAVHAGVKTAPQFTREADLHLVLETGQIIRPLRTMQDYVLFMLPSGATQVWLASRTFRPCDVEGPFVDDRRQMGVAVGHVLLKEGTSPARRVSLPVSPEAGSGWQAQETGTTTRWTGGNAILTLGPRATNTAGMLMVQVTASGIYGIQKGLPASTCMISLQA